jgi:arylsulfatase A-like enzyme
MTLHTSPKLQVIKRSSKKLFVHHNTQVAFKSYFGGRFEILKRGFIGHAYLFDINSAYPYYPYYAGGHPVIVQNGTIVPRPDNGTYSNDLYTNIMLNQMKKYQGNGKPKFMYLAFQGAQDYIKKYQGVYDIGYDKIREQRFEKQKQLGIWPSDMQMPKRIPPVEPWNSLTPDQKAHRAKVCRSMQQ